MAGQPGEVWVPVDSSGPIGVYSCEDEAKAAVHPFLSALWRGAIMKYQVKCLPENGEEMCCILPQECPIPIFVGTTKESLEYHSQFDGTGILESRTDLEYRKCTFGEMLPPAKARLMPLLKSTQSGQMAHHILMELMKDEKNAANAMVGNAQAPSDFEFEVPVASYLADMSVVGDTADAPAASPEEPAELLGESLVEVGADEADRQQGPEQVDTDLSLGEAAVLVDGGETE